MKRIFSIIYTIWIYLLFLLWYNYLIDKYEFDEVNVMIPISDIIIRSISGYVFIVPIIILYYLFLGRRNKKQTFLHIIVVSVFRYYLFGILTVTGIGFTKSVVFRPNLSFVPFVGMLTGPIDTMLNIILFVPMGLFLPLLYKKYNSIKTVALTGFLFSLSVEIVQMFGWGSSDVNDLMTNTIGACLGFFAYKLILKVLPAKVQTRLYSNNINEFAEMIFFAVCTFIIMVTAQRWIVHGVLNIP